MMNLSTKRWVYKKCRNICVLNVVLALSVISLQSELRSNNCSMRNLQIITLAFFATLFDLAIPFAALRTYYRVPLKNYQIRRSDARFLQSILFNGRARDSGPPDSEIAKYNSAIDACMKSKPINLEKGFEIFKEMKSIGMIPSAYTYSILIAGYGRARQTDTALSFFKEMETLGIKKNVVVYNSMISALEKTGRCDEALSLLGDHI